MTSTRRQFLQVSAAAVALAGRGCAKRRHRAGTDWAHLEASLPDGAASHPLRIRKDMRCLTDGEVLRLQHAFARLLEKNGPVDYQGLAKIHGTHCIHSGGFLAWHRAYLLKFETELQKIDSAVTLPYWPWHDPAMKNSELPALFTMETMPGSGMANPLLAAPISELHRMTTREPQSPLVPENIHREVEYALTNATDYEDFNVRICDQPHATIHSRIACDMATTPYAAFDPIFWFHHATVDMLWDYWQSSAAGVDPPSYMLNMDLTPFDQKVKDVLSCKQLGYGYERRGLPPLPRPFTEPRWDMLDLKPRQPHVPLYLLNLKQPPPAMAFDVFVNQPDANPATPRVGNPHYAGSFGFFTSPHEHQHDAHPHEHQPAVLERWEAIDLGPTLVRLKAANPNPDNPEIQITLLATDPAGKPVERHAFPFTGTQILRR